MKLKNTFLVLLLCHACISFCQVNTSDITIKNDSIVLPGTLSYTSKTAPIIIWIHGSGQIDRHGNQPTQGVKANYIKQFRDAINKKNIAFFSYDKRTATKKNIKFLKNTLFIDFVKDAKAVIEHIKSNYAFSKLIIVGHSQGSLVGMLAAKHADKFISIAGAGNTLDNVLIKQIGKKNPTLAAAAQTQLDTLKKYGKIETVNPFLMQLFAKPNQAFLKSWLNYNPLKEIAKLAQPTLIVYGGKDLQTSKEDAINLATARGSVNIVAIANMNHVLKTITKDADNLKSYFSEDYPISKKLISEITKFVNH